MLRHTDDDLSIRIQNILDECNMNLSDLINVINIYCNNLSELKKEQSINNYRYIAAQISKNSWAIVDKNNMVIQTIVDDELIAFRKARIYSTTKIGKMIS